MRPSFGILRLLGEVWRDFLALFPLLMAAALIVFVPISLIDSTTELFHHVADHAGTGEIVGAILAGLVGALFSLVGAVVYSAIVCSLVHSRRGLGDHSLAHALRDLDYTRLAVADVLYAVLVSIGLVFLLVPGLILMTRLALIAPAIEIERLGIRDAMRRSRELVRPHFWKVLIVVVPLSFGSDLVSDLAWDGATGALGETFLGGWLGSLLGELLTAPFLGLFVVLAFLHLRETALDERSVVTKPSVG